MGYRARCVLAVVAALSGAVWASGTANGDADTPRQHPGAVQDRFLKIPLAADILAWEGTASASTSDQGSCPQFGDKPIDSRQSAPDGQFAVQIQSSEQVYTLTYCKFGYFPRVDHNLPNDPDGTPVLPTPAQLWPQTPPDTDAANAAYDALVRNYMVASLNELAYLRKINPGRFKGLYNQYAEAIGKVEDGRADVVRSFEGLIERWDNPKAD